ncbi:YeiH family protein [Carboxydothermus hydrogenoformans]|nr:putative sulfate exporter family transporter [Carboxydothermus hydrogenoformans]
MMSNKQGSEFLKKEDWWAVYLGIGIVLVALILYKMGLSIKPIAVAPPKWESFSEVTKHFAENGMIYVYLYLMFLVLFSISVKFMGFNVGEFIKGFTIIYLLTVIVLVLGSSKVAEQYNLEPPLLALLLGLIVSNVFKLPKWLDTSFRTEFYIKTGIVLLGATLPFTLIVKAGPIALLQATVISVTTFLTIFFAATRLFGLEKPFGATLGAGGSICGVSASIAVGGAVNAKKEHVSISIALVTIFAVIMIFLLPFVCKALGLPPGQAGAWIGSSEFADAAGLAAASAIGDEAAIKAFTLMKVIGRDIWIGIWCLILAVVAATKWEKRAEGASVSAKEVWVRFPKFVIGFFIATILISIVDASLTPQVSKEVLTPLVIKPIKTLRTWAFVFCFLSIGFTTRFRELSSFGWKPLAAFVIGVIVNVLLGYTFSVHILGDYWSKL